MKLLVAVLFAVCALAAADEWDNIDWDKVVPVEDLPGFWDDKDPILKPIEGSNRNGRIVGGAQAAAHQFPFQVAVLTTFGGGGTGLCGGSVIGPVSVQKISRGFIIADFIICRLSYSLLLIALYPEVPLP